MDLSLFPCIALGGLFEESPEIPAEPPAAGVPLSAGGPDGAPGGPPARLGGAVPGDVERDSIGRNKGRLQGPGFAF